MPNEEATLRRTLHIRFTAPGADPAQLLMMLKAAEPFFGLFGGMRTRLLQNVDDPAKFVQIVDYEAPEAVEVNRQGVVSDPRLQAYLQTWRTFMPGAAEIDVYQEVGA
jgi:hypothetical protein